MVATELQQENFKAINGHENWSESLKDVAINNLEYQSPNNFNTWLDAECADVTNRKNGTRMEASTKIQF